MITGAHPPSGGGDQAELLGLVESLRIAILQGKIDEASLRAAELAQKKAAINMELEEVKDPREKLYK